MTNWIKLADQVPAFNKEILVKTAKNVFYVASLQDILTNSQGTHYNWRTKLDIADDFLNMEKHYGKIIEWCEIPN